MKWQQDYGKWVKNKKESKETKVGRVQPPPTGWDVFFVKRIWPPCSLKTGSDLPVGGVFLAKRAIWAQFSPKAGPVMPCYAIQSI